jgi:hypothetical protein
MSKYEGTTQFHLAYSELINAARFRGLTTYQALAQLCNLPLTGNKMGADTGEILGMITRQEMDEGRPMLSAVCVGVSGEPGEGFFGLAKRLGRFDSVDPKERMAFWRSELQAVYEAWKIKY